MDLSGFKELFTSFSQISPFKFEVRDASGTVLFSEPGGSNIPVSEMLDEVSDQVVSRKAYYYKSIKGTFDVSGVPIETNGGVAGVLMAYGSKTDMQAKSQRETQVERMEPFLTQISGLIEDKCVYQKESEEMAMELAQSFEDLNLYSRIAARVKAVRFSNKMLEDLMMDILESMRTQIVFTFLPERPEFNIFIDKEKIGGKITDPQAFVQDLINAIPADAPSLSMGYFMVTDSANTPEYRNMHPEPFRFLGVKIQYEEDFYGWLGMVSFNLKEIFRRGEMSLLISVSEQVALVISNTDLYRDLESFVINVGSSLVHAIEAKDPYTRGHSERVNRYSMLIADALDMEHEEKNVLNWASILHDIGKIGIPESILNKPGKLTTDEYETIKAHPEKGHTILKPLEQISDSLPGILHHHERYDGNGYPAGLAGEEIPLNARIIAVADTFDAINSNRAYRAARPPNEAVEILERVAGSQLDSNLIEIFKQVYYSNFKE